MGDLFRLIWYALIGMFRSRAELEAEILVLRHQLNVMRRKSPKRVALSSIDRLLLVGLYRLAPRVLDALKIIRPETLMRHRCRTDHGRKVHGEEKAAAVARLEDLPSQSRRRHRIDGLVPGPDDLVSAVVRVSDPAA